MEQIVTTLQPVWTREDSIYELLRPQEICRVYTEVYRKRVSEDDKKDRIIAIIQSNDRNGDEFGVLVLKPIGPKRLAVVDILPIYSDFRLSLAQNKPVVYGEGETATPISITSHHSDATIFVLKISSFQGQTIRFETDVLEEFQDILVELKQSMAIAQAISFQHGGKNHDWIQHYLNLKQQALLTSVSTITETDSTVTGSKGSKNGLVSPMSATNPFLDIDGSHSLKMAKEGWIAKELRVREPNFSKYSKMKVFVGSFNVNGQSVLESLRPWLGTSPEDEPDMYVIGLQEVDLSTEAFILSDTTKEEEWCRSIESALRTHSERYMKVISKQLVGMLILVYVKSSMFPFIHDASSESVGTGLLGMMGNKGAVGVRLKLYDSYLSFVNVHLAADTSMVDRRNQDYAEICKRLQFPLPPRFKDFMSYMVSHPWVANFIDAASSNGGVLSGISGKESSDSAPAMSRVATTLFDCDHLIFFGDMNYRVKISDVEAKTLIEKQDITGLLTYDQLAAERAAGKVFHGFDEGPITFYPTFKFDVGTNTYDTSEKKRSPSWCDRILWFKNPLKKDDPEWIVQKTYDSCKKLVMSDHKPIMSLFELKIRHLDSLLLTKVQQEITRELDKFENDSVPDISISGNNIQFGKIRYMSPITKTIVVENRGQVIAQYKFLPKEGLSSRSEKKGDSAPVICKPWCYVSPSSSALLPGEKLKLNVTILVDQRVSGKLNDGSETLDDILVMHVEHGKDLFLSVNATWLPSCFGTDIDLLCGLVNPIRDYSIQEIQTVAKRLRSGSQKTDLPSPANEDPQEENDFTGPALGRTSVPKELWKLTEFIFKFGMDVDNIFTTTGDPAIIQYLRECLDCGIEFNLSILLSNAPVEYLSELPMLESLEDSPRESMSLDPNNTCQTPLDIDSLLAKLDKSTLSHGTIKVPKSKGRSISVHSAAETLLRFLEALPEPVIPYAFQKKCVTEGFATYSAAKQVLQHQGFPVHHKDMFVYMASFLRELVGSYQGRGGFSSEKLAQIFAPVLLRSETSTLSGKGTSAGNSPIRMPETVAAANANVEQFHKRRWMFLQHFIENV